MANHTGKYVSRIVAHDYEIERKGYGLLNAVTAYTRNESQPGSGRLMQLINRFGKSDSGEGILYRMSNNNGMTWQDIDVLDRSYQAGHGRHVMRKIAGDCLYDDDAGVMLRIVTEMLWENDEILSLFKKRRMYYNLSFDNGTTWTDAIYIHRNEAGYDKNRMFPGITYGVNMVTSLFKAHKIRGEGRNKGKIAVGIQVQIVDSDGEIYNPTGMGFFKSGCILGSWNADKLEYDWEICETYAEVTPEESTRGVYEPVIQELDDGRLFMILRGSNMKRHDTIPGTKFISVSDDQGRTWSKPTRLTYDDGQLMYSSSSCPDLVKDRQGRIFYTGIITSDNPNGNLPRYPLCIARLNTDTLTIEHDSVTVIDTRRTWHEAQEQQRARYPVDFSNHHSYLDANEDKIIVHAPFRADLHHFETVINKYDIYMK